MCSSKAQENCMLVDGECSFPLPFSSSRTDAAQAWCMVMSASLGGASFFMTQADMIQALVVMFHPNFAPTDWQMYLVRQASYPRTAVSSNSYFRSTWLV